MCFFPFDGLGHTIEAESKTFTTLDGESQVTIDKIFHPESGLATMFRFLVTEATLRNSRRDEKTQQLDERASTTSDATALLCDMIDTSLEKARRQLSTDDGTLTVDINPATFTEEAMMKGVSDTCLDHCDGLGIAKASAFLLTVLALLVCTDQSFF